MKAFITSNKSIVFVLVVKVYRFNKIGLQTWKDVHETEGYWFIFISIVAMLVKYH